MHVTPLFFDDSSFPMQLTASVCFQIFIWNLLIAYYPPILPCARKQMHVSLPYRWYGNARIAHGRVNANATATSAHPFLRLFTLLSLWLRSKCTATTLFNNYNFNYLIVRDVILCNVSSFLKTFTSSPPALTPPPSPVYMDGNKHSPPQDLPTSCLVNL